MKIREFETELQRRYNKNRRKERRVNDMRKIGKILFAGFVLISAVIFSQTVQAARYKTLYTNSGWPVEDRTVGGTVFSSDYSTLTESSRLFAEKDGRTVTISTSFNGGAVISNGSTVYYCAKSAGRPALYKASVSKGTSKKMGNLAGAGHYVDLAGLYKNTVYYIIDVPEGEFARFTLKNGKSKKLRFGEAVTSADQKGKYFILTDGTGAGYSYLGAYNALKGKFRRFAKSPCQWHIVSKYVYFAEVIKGEAYANQPYTIRVKRYAFSGGKTKTLVKSLKVKEVMKISTKGITYKNISGKKKTKKW